VGAKVIQVPSSLLKLSPQAMTQHTSIAKQVTKCSYATRSERDAGGNNLAPAGELAGCHCAHGESRAALPSLGIWAKGREIGRGRRNNVWERIQ